MNVPASKSPLQCVSCLILVVILLLNLTVLLIIFRYIQPSPNNLYVSFMFVLRSLFICVMSILSSCMW
jgi:hypothetical protein